MKYLRCFFVLFDNVFIMFFLQHSCFAYIDTHCFSTWFPSPPTNLLYYHQEIVWPSLTHLYGAFGPTLAASVRTHVQISSNLRNEQTQSSRSLLSMGKWRWLFPHSRVFRLWVWLFKSVKPGTLLVKGVLNLGKDTCPVFHWTLVQRHSCVVCRGWKTRRNESVGKEHKPSNIRGNKWQDILKDGTFKWRACVTWPCMSLVMLCHLTSLEPHAHEKLWNNMAAVFAWLQKLTQAGLSANNSLSCSWNNSYGAFGPTLAASVWTHVQIRSNQLKSPKKAAALFLSIGNGGDTSPPPSDGFGGVTRPSATQPPGTTFPTDQLPPSWRFLRQWQLLLTKHQQGYFG